MAHGKLILKICAGALVAASAGGAAAADPAGRYELSWRSGKSLRQKDADLALREALLISANGAVRELEAQGAFDAPNRRIALPETLEAMRGDWNSVGRSGALERLQTAMNAAAAVSVASAGAPLKQAIATVDFFDPAGIVLSGDRAASQFLALRTRADLERDLRPVVVAALAQSGAFAALTEAGEAVGQADKANGYRDPVTQRTLTGVLDALFEEIGRNEQGLRAEPAGRGSPLLEQVFSAAPISRLARGGG
ncbi:MAG: DUF4197 family protein [Hyphomonadaceae bacterium]